MQFITVESPAIHTVIGVVPPPLELLEEDEDELDEDNENEDEDVRSLELLLNELLLDELLRPLELELELEPELVEGFPPVTESAPNVALPLPFAQSPNEAVPPLGDKAAFHAAGVMVAVVAVVA